MDVDIKVDETNYAQVNIYSPNTKTEQLASLLDLGEMLKTKDLYDKHIVLAGDFISFYLLFSLFLDSYGSKPTLKKKIYSQIY